MPTIVGMTTFMSKKNFMLNSVDNLIFILIISVGDNSKKIVDELYSFFYPHHLVILNNIAPSFKKILLYQVLCNKFHENILDGIKVIKQTQYS